MNLIFRNATIVTDGLEMSGDLAVKEGKVAALGDLAAFEAGTEIDATGKTLVPGGVDLGVNLLHGGAYDPDSGAGFALAARDAALGGVTTIVSTIDLSEEQDPVEALKSQADADAAKAFVDFGYHLHLGGWTSGSGMLARRLIGEGVCSFWLSRPSGDHTEMGFRDVFEAMSGLPPEGLLILSPFDPGSAPALEERLLSQSPINATRWAGILPPACERAFVWHVCEYLGLSRLRVLVASLSSEEGVRAAGEARSRTPRLYVSAALPHLVYTATEEAPRVWPPLRDAADQTALYHGIEEGVISAIVSDYKPRTPGEAFGRELGEGDRLPPVGVATLRHTMPLLHSEGAAKFRASFPALVQAMTADAAKLAGVYPAKGSLLPGADADIVVLDPTAERSPILDSSAGTRQMNFVDPMSELSFKGSVAAVYLRGRQIANAAEGLMDRPGGQFLNRRLSLR